MKFYLVYCGDISKHEMMILRRNRVKSNTLKSVDTLTFGLYVLYCVTKPRNEYSTIFKLQALQVT